MSTRQPTEEELAALEAQLKQLRVEDVLLDNVIGMLNLAMRRSGLVRGAEDERDPEQVRLGIDAVVALLPLLERVAGAGEAASLRDALSQLQLAYVRMQGEAPPAGAAAGMDPAGAGAGTPGAGAPGGAGQPAGAGAGTSPAGDDAAAGGEPSKRGEPQEPDGPQQPDEPPKPDEPGPAQRSGRLWVPGQ
jgi:hypothetical protein